ncbi:hypothetical protein AC565_18750 [Klebsiella pneumoniae]|nr:hypothetical protein Q770_02495 [Klebsiella pneumoniae subsp. pneumoniae PittNDM01]ALH83343.1 hypothetical protein AN966_00005 [Klebsiella pneumoniae]AMA19047.1 hypothetical protein AWN66_26390 [Klebsiella pneumoniae subsp. pneumoniae]ALP79451.1 hypothetical protein AC565_18750 [Klebsiella pneumoniae]AMA25994.1 hypothetical protein RJF2_17120 [Klebsiella pneumoniae subsp. pneumoniae]
MTRNNATISDNTTFINGNIVPYKAIFTYGNFTVFRFLIIIGNQMKIFIQKLNPPRNHTPFSNANARIRNEICFRPNITVV